MMEKAQQFGVREVLSFIRCFDIHARSAIKGRMRPAYVLILSGLYSLLLLSAVLYNSISTRHIPRRLELPFSRRSLTPDQCLTRELLEKPLSAPHLRQVLGEYECGCRQPDTYESHEQPRVTAIVQSYNHQGNVESIATALKDNPMIDEIIVCEDGSKDDSLYRWMTHLRGLTHFIVLSNNLHEVRCYNRAMRMSSSEYFVLLQDDDIPPSMPSAPKDINANDATQPSDWVSEAISLFDADPDLGVLSGFIGQLWSNEKGYEFGEQQSDHGGLRKGDTRRIPFLSRATLGPFMYVECAWAAPLFIRAKAVHRMGGLNINLFKKRQPGVWQDCVLSYEAWKVGWRVGVYEARFERGVGGHGTTKSKKSAKLRDTVWKRAKNYVDRNFDRTYIGGFAMLLNNRTLELRYTGA